LVSNLLADPPTLTDSPTTLRCPQVKLAESAQGVEVVKKAWQAPVGGYSTDFAVVTLKAKMAAYLGLKGDKQCLDYYTRHLKARIDPAAQKFKDQYAVYITTTLALRYTC
jgi:hypothetical protein